MGFELTASVVIFTDCSLFRLPHTQEISAHLDHYSLFCGNAWALWSLHAVVCLFRLDDIYGENPFIVFLDLSSALAENPPITTVKPPLVIPTPPNPDLQGLL